MRIFTLFFFLIACCCLSLTAQEAKTPQNLVQEAKAVGQDFLHATPFILNHNKSAFAAEIGAIHNYEILNIQTSQLQQLAKSSPDAIQLTIPFGAKNHLQLELVKVDIHSSDFEVIEASTNLPAKVDLGSHYRGVIKNNADGFAAISIFDGEIMGMISTSDANWVLGKMKNSVDSKHIIYDDHDVIRELGFECGTPDDGKPYSAEELATHDAEKDLSDCVRLFFEVDYDIFLDKGGTNAAAAYVSGLVNQVSTLYATESINTVISQILVWDTTSPYTGGSSSNMLGQFQANNNDWNGDLAQLLSYQSSGGVAAGFNGICNSNRNASMSFSSISGSYNTVPTYSWSVMVVTHEFGHLFGSRHTHACVWNGNGTAIDGCAGFVEGGCDLPGFPSQGGTIMSYCHLQSVGINFNEGFGPQPGNVIRNVITNATCLFECGPPSCQDGIQNGDETGVDCGGPDCDPCPTCDDGIQNGDETGVDCGGPDCDACPCFDNQLTLTIILDNYPEETTWDIRNLSGAVMAFGGSYGHLNDGSTVVEPICLVDGCFNFTIYDSYGDGICCGYGQGSYVLTDVDGTVLASGGSFGQFETTNICVSGDDPDPTCDDGIQNGNETGVDCGGPDCDPCPTCDDGIQNGDETGVDCGGPDCPACPTCDDGIQNGNETGVDCGGPDCAPCPTCDDGEQNGDETGVDCGGPDCPACPTCDDGIQNGDETGVDCGGPDCAPCATCDDGEQNGDETGVDCGGPDCPACPTCDDGIQNGDETGVDCGGPDCAPCATCDDGIQNGDETGVDCGGSCPRCDDEPTCNDGIQNGNETGVDCGGPDCAPCATCDDGEQNGDETGVDCGGPDCPACPTCNDGIQNGNETGVDCGGPDCAPCATCDDGEQNGDETGVDCGGPDCPACPTCNDGIQNGDETGVDCGGPECPECPMGCTENDLTLTINLDDYPDETSWEITQDGTLVLAGGPYETGTVVSEDICLPDGCYIFTMIDAFGDGICCEWGEGSYSLVNNADGSVLANGGDFSYYDNTYVSLGDATCPTCDDGIQNGDETGVDCGGAFCEPCGGFACAFETFDYEDFESGWGIWNDGGSDARRHIRDRFFAYSGDYCVRLRDNSSTSVMTSDILDFSGIEEIKVSFIFYPRSMENGEGFYLEISHNGGASYEAVGEWRSGSEFSNNQYYYDEVSISGVLSANTRLRFRCDASQNSDLVYLDDVEILTCMGSGLIEDDGTEITNLSQDEHSLNLVNPSETTGYTTTDMRLFPNPVSDMLNITMSLQEATQAQLFLTDVNGKLIVQEQLLGASGKQSTTMDVSNLMEGVYFLHLISGDSKVSRKFIIAR